jgi:hypothetical protein
MLNNLEKELEYATYEEAIEGQEVIKGFRSFLSEEHQAHEDDGLQGSEVSLSTQTTEVVRRGIS